MCSIYQLYIFSTTILTSFSFLTMSYKFIVLCLCLYNSWTMQGWSTWLPSSHRRGHNPHHTHCHCCHRLPHQQETKDWWVPVTIEVYKSWFMRIPAIPVYRNLNAVMYFLSECYLCMMNTDGLGSVQTMFTMQGQYATS